MHFSDPTLTMCSFQMYGVYVTVTSYLVLFRTPSRGPIILHIVDNKQL